MNGERIFLALGELEEDLVREAALPPRRASGPRRLLLIAAAAALLTALLAAAAYSGPILRQFFTAIGDEIIVLGEDRRGLRSGGEEVCFIRDGRIILSLDGVERDITKKCSDTKYYAWDQTYDDGTRLLLFVGGTPERMGYFYVYLFPGHSPYNGHCTFDMPSFYDYANAPWVAKAEKDYSLEFLGLTAVPDHGDLKVPAVAELIEHGYPVNARGETYGPAGFEKWLGEPDLELAIGSGGAEGYIRRSELDEATGAGRVHSPEEAIAWTEYVRNRGPVEIPVYREDGETVVDRFVIR